MKKGLKFLMLTGLAIAVAGCGAATNRHISKNFDYTWANACTWENLPASCSILSEHFTFNVAVDQLPNGEYTITGDAVINEWERRYESVYNATFTFLLGEEGTIDEAIYYYANAGDLQSGFPINAQFASTRDFDALFVNYEIFHYNAAGDAERDSFYERRLEPKFLNKVLAQQKQR